MLRILRNPQRTRALPCFIKTFTSAPKVLLSIHGYPRRYNAGSEVYTQTLALGLYERAVPVAVFAREENPFKADYVLTKEQDPLNPSIPVYIVNHARSNIRYNNEHVDAEFAKVLNLEKPDIVHMGHLNHLSTGLVKEAKNFGAKIVFTLHDFWLMCPRGQFLQTGLDGGEPWKLCSGQEDKKCATKCMNRFHTGEIEKDEDVGYWTRWVGKRREGVRNAANLVDLFLAPSEHLRDRFINEFDIPREKIKYIDYGFDLKRLPRVNRSNPRTESGDYVFGYIGRHHPSKGIDMLIRAFSKVSGKAKLIVWGRHDGQLTASLVALAKQILKEDQKIEWRSEYKNEEIVSDVFAHCDCIVVPSIWDENSPLVIHEAQQVRVPVITADHGGMSEFVQHGVNGLTFRHRDDESLVTCLQTAIDDPNRLKKLGARGYIKSMDGNIPSIEQHVDELIQEYQSLLHPSPSPSSPSTLHTSPFSPLPTSPPPSSPSIPSLSSPSPSSPSSPSSPLPHNAVPWRITFDTNPDDCNLKCIMCEEHSIYSNSQAERKAGNTRKRRMSIETLRSVVAECAGKGLREIIPSTMGEPLMFKEFPEIIEICKTHGVKLNLTTNGTFFGRGVTKWGNMILPVASDVKISWNGASKEMAEKVMVGVRFEEVLENLKEFLTIRDDVAKRQGNRATVTLQLTFMEVNLLEIPRIVELALDLGVDRIKGHHLWAHFDQIKSLNMRRNKESIEKWNEIVRECHAIADQKLLPNGKKIVLENIFELNPSATQEIHPDAVCPFLGKEAWVNHAGRFDPCCAPDKERKQLGQFGNVAENGLLPIWQGEAYENLRKNYLEKKLCQGCNMRRI